ncbi:MAG: thrombospondin type 3 repeat-containing protein, partial [Chloroflexota bacterium]
MKYRYLSLFILLISLFLVGTVVKNVAAQTAVSTTTEITPAEAVQNAWQSTKDSGVYDFRANYEQTRHLAPSLKNAGKDPIEDQLFIEGQVNEPAESLEMTMWRTGGPESGNALAMRVEGTTAYGRVGGGEWEEVDNFSDVFAPGGDPLGFLAGATNVAKGETVNRSFDNGPTITLTRYSFDFDGAPFAEHLRQQMEIEMQKRGELPAGISLETPKAYRTMVGQGEIWLDPAGLPRELSIDLELPDLPNGDRITAVVQSSFSNFDTDRIAIQQTTLLQDPIVWVGKQLPATSQEWITATQTINFTLIVLLVVFLATLNYRTRYFHIILALLLIGSMLASPLMRSHEVRAFSDNQHAQRVASEAEAKEAEKQEEAQEALNSSTWQPNTPPAEQPNTQQLTNSQSLISQSPNAAASLSTTVATSQSPSDHPTTTALFSSAPTDADLTTTDTDGDGLSDADEVAWRTCPQTGLADDRCTGVVDSTDSDGDGLTDGQEVNQIGTVPTLEDTDGDTISDKAEVEGYTDNQGINWYLDPYELDSNRDGLPDGAECPAWSSLTTNPTPGSICPDTDGDGDPDIFDDDNDGDGVPDDVDL